MKKERLPVSRRFFIGCKRQIQIPRARQQLAKKITRKGDERRYYVSLLL
jgi:hypothetical protein